MALLPGLEEETSEDFDRIFQIFSAFRKAVNIVLSDESHDSDGVGDEYFWQCFFLASITSPSRRQGALAFLVRRLPKIQDPPRPSHGSNLSGTANDGSVGKLSAAVEAIVSPEPGLLVRCFASGLTDEQILIQRGFLDLLVTHLPLHSSVLQTRVSGDDLEKLVAAAVSVVARRDMSLNRRLWTWILGPENQGQNDTETAPDSPMLQSTGASTPTGRHNPSRTRYFEQFGLNPLVDGIHHSIQRGSANPAERARPFRVCLSLMDRWEVGGLVIPAVFLPSLDSVRRYECLAPSKEQFIDVVRSASVFFDGVESGMIWGELLELIVTAMTDRQLDVDTRLQKLLLVRFIITHFNVHEEEMLMVHIPLVALTLLSLLNEAPSCDQQHSDQEKSLDPQVVASALVIAEALIDLVPERSLRIQAYRDTSASPASQEHKLMTSEQNLVSNIRQFYAQDQGNLDISRPPLSPRDTVQRLLHESVGLVKNHLMSPAVKVDLEIWTRPLILLLSRQAGFDSTLSHELLLSIKCAVQSVVAQKAHLSFSSFAAIVSITSFLVDLHPEDEFDTILAELIALLVREAWFHLSPSRPQHHVETTRGLWQLQASLPLG